MGDLNSLRSVSTRSLHNAKSGKQVEKTLEFDQFIKLACQKFSCPCKFVVVKHGHSLRNDNPKLVKLGTPPKQETSPKQETKQKKVTPERQEVAKPVTPDTADIDLKEFEKIGDTLTITAHYDSLNRLAGIVLQKEKVPTILIKFFGLVLPFQPLLSRLVFKKCRLSAYSMSEISKFLPMTSITDICLDDTRIHEANYALLLQKPSALTSLSLCRCNITDEVCAQIASTLKIAEPAETKMATLNLSSNHITDTGAKYFAEALRTNRHLRHLNLADNRITDEGADHIFQALIEFPLTYDEIVNKRRRRMDYLKARHSLYTKFYRHESYSMDNLNSDTSNLYMKKEKKTAAVHMRIKSKGSIKTKGKGSARTEDAYQSKTDFIANELMDPFVDPFDEDSVITVDGYIWCVGNMVLCYLNLSYNDLTYVSLKKLHAVLHYQTIHKKQYDTGLLRVMMDGNLLPRSCKEMEGIQEMLKRNIINWTPRFSSTLRNKRYSKSDKR